MDVDLQDEDRDLFSYAWVSSFSGLSFFHPTRKLLPSRTNSVGAMAKPVLADPRSLFGKASVHSGISRVAVGQNLVAVLSKRDFPFPSHKT